MNMYLLKCWTEHCREQFSRLTAIVDLLFISASEAIQAGAISPSSVVRYGIGLPESHIVGLLDQFGRLRLSSQMVGMC